MVKILREADHAPRSLVAQFRVGRWVWGSFGPADRAAACRPPPPLPQAPRAGAQAICGGGRGLAAEAGRLSIVRCSEQDGGASGRHLTRIFTAAGTGQIASPRPLISGSYSDKNQPAARGI